MSLGQPLWLFAGGLVALALVLFFRRADRRRERDLARFASARLLGELAVSLSPAKRRAKRALLIGAVALLFLGLAEPQAGFHWEETSRRGVDVLIALDVSRSMLARDIAPDRLTRAKLAIIDLADRLAGDRFGLVAFAGTAFLQCPLTLDHAAFQQALDVLEPGIIPAPGSDLASALTVADEALQSEKRNVKLVVLVSDGEDLGGGAIAAAEKAAKDGDRVYTIGVGSSAGELIPIPREGGATDFVKDESGRYVKSRLDEETLRRVAEATGGFYEPLGARGEGIDALVERAIAPIPKEELASRMRRVPVDRFQWPVAVALALLAAEMLLSERRRTASWSWPRRGSKERAVDAGAAALVFGLASALTASGLAFATASQASPARGQELFAAGEYERALEEYREAAKGDRDDPRLDFNVGASAYKAGRFDEATAAFARALRSESKELQEKSFYNLGNAQFRFGERQLEGDPKQTMNAWKQSLEAYDQALALAEKDEDARHNRDLVRAALEKLQEEQKKQQQQQQPGKPDDRHGEKKPSDQSQERQEQQAQPSDGSDSDSGDKGSPQENQPGGGEEKRHAEQGQPEGSSAGQPSAADQKQPAGEAGKKESGDQAKKGEPPEGTGDAGDRSKKIDRATPEQGNPENARSDAAESRRPGDASAHDGEAASDTAPGQMTPMDARQLLDSLRSEERRVPVMAGAASPPGRGIDPARRDW